ncbi:hypothetical protein J11TS1_21580 [Oceanobacillus sp. J11TS1]|nr:hypothetical protein J11TS1_21580 [Oceanobacillus sp. J11TS1]
MEWFDVIIIITRCDVYVHNKYLLNIPCFLSLIVTNYKQNILNSESIKAVQLKLENDSLLSSKEINCIYYTINPYIIIQ